MTLVDPSGSAITPKAELVKAKIHKIEIPIPKDLFDLPDQEVLRRCHQPVLMPIQLAPNLTVQVISKLTMGLNGAETLLVMETSQALDELRQQVADLKAEIAELKRGGS